MSLALASAVAEALDPEFTEGEETAEEPPKAPEEPGRGSRPRWGGQQRATAWDWPNRARGPQGMEKARVIGGSFSDRYGVTLHHIVSDGLLWHNGPNRAKG
jgi:hypothetical protein